MSKGDGKCNWGVIDTDNFGGDYPNEKWIIQAWLSERGAQEIADVLNKESGENSPRYYKVEQQGYKLQPGFEP